MRNERKSLICPKCGKLINSDESKCPYCGLSKPGSSWRQKIPTRILRNPRDLIASIIYANVVLYIISIVINPSGLEFSSNPLTFLSPSSNSILLMGATGTIPIMHFNRWWTLVSASYLHGGVLHIFFNMMALRQLGPFVAREYGTSRFFIIYTISGVAGFLVSYLAGVTFTIGASASLCGLIGSALYFGKSRGGFYGEAIFKQVMGWVVGLALFGFMLPGINNWAHGGGVLAGILMGFLLDYEEKSQESPVHRILGVACMAVTVLVLIWAVSQTLIILFSSK